MALLLGMAVVAAAVAAPPAARGPAGMAAAGAPVVVGMTKVDIPDPFPIDRLRVTEAQLPDAAKAFVPGPLTSLPRPAFEAKVRAAGEMAFAAKAQPRLVEAKYTATTSGAALAGTAEWTITYIGIRPTLLALDPLKVALRDATWADGSPAAVGAFAELPGGGAGVWVPGPGRHVLRAKWTAAGVGSAAERAFDLRFPACAASALDLDLPADRTPVAGADVFVTGPVPGAPAGKRRWTLRFGERARVDLAVRGPADGGGAGPVVFVAAARYDLAPAETACEFDLDVRATRGTATEWAFVPSPGLRVTDVTVNNRAGWWVDPATKELRVTLRQPAAAAKVRVSAAAALPAGTGPPVPLPTVRPTNGLPSDEKADIHLAPGLDLTVWEPGDFRLADTTTAADGSRTLSLVGTLLPPGAVTAARRPPGVRATDSGPAFTTTEAVAWRVECGRTRLTARVAVKVRRGPLFRVAVRPPPGFVYDRAATTPAELLGFAAPGAGRALVVEFSRPLAAGQDVEVVLEFRGPSVPPGPVVRLPFPAIGVPGARERDGSVSLAPGQGWEAFAHVRPDTGDDADPAVVRYRGVEPAGELVLSAVRPAFASSVETQFDLTSGRLAVTSVVRLDVSAGLVGGVAVFEPGVANPARTWKVTDGSNTVAAATAVRLGDFTAALALLGRAADGYSALVATASAGREEPGTLWLVRFSRPVDDDLALETTAVFPADPASAARLAGDWAAGRRGLVVRGAATRTTRADVPPALGGVLPTRPAGAPPAEWAVENLSLKTTCTEYDVVATLHGVVTARGGRDMPVSLPAGAVARSAAVGGYAVDPAALAGIDLRLPIPAGNEPVPFVVRYRLPRERRGVAWVVASPPPDLPGNAGEPQSEWEFAPDVAAAWPFVVSPGATVVVVPDRFALAAGVGVAALVGGLGWLGVRAASRAVGLLLLALAAAAGVAVAAGPPAWARAAWPVVVVGLPAAAAVVVKRGRLPRAGVAAGVLLAVAVGVSAQPTRAVVVLVVTGPTGETVVASPDLLDRLDALARPPAPAPVIVAAVYDGRVEDGMARVTASFTVQAFGPGEQAAHLPLADVRLERVAVNGRPANPTAAGAGRYTVALPGPGRHAVEVRFAVPVAVTGAEREVKFGVPEVPDARVALTAPPAARQPQVAGRLGALVVAPADPTRFEADLGAAKTVAVRWREGPGGAGRLTVREGCVWDVAEAGAVLTACYDIRAESGTAAAFRFDLPPGLEPVRVAARALESAGAVAVQSWGVGADKGGVRQLRIDLAAPADGRVLVTIECHNRAAPTRQPVLHVPKPVGMDRRGGVYGLRATGVGVEAVGRSGVIDFAADAMMREFGAITELRLVPGAALQAFNSQTADAPELRPTLRVGPDPGTARVEATWAADLRGAVGVGTITWSADAPAVLLEFALAAKVREVRGADVAAWNQAGDRVQVWFRRAVPNAAVTWVADLSHDASGKAADATAFEPPLPRPLGPATGALVLRVRPADGVGLKVERDTGWTADAAGDEREWALRAAGVVAPVRLYLAASRVGTAAGFGLLDLSGREATYRVAVELPVAAGRPVHAVVRVAGLPPGATATLEPPAGVRVSALDTGDGEAAWNLDAPAPAAAVRVAVAVRFPAGWAGPLPAVSAGTGNVVRYVGRIGRPDARLNGSSTATPIERAEVGAIWPGEVERIRRTGGEVLTVGGPVELAPAPPAVPQEILAPPALPAAASVQPVIVTPPGIAEAAGWGLALLGVGVLFIRYPRATWPEQAAVLAGMLGHAVAAAAVVGVIAFLAARAVWVYDRLRPGRRVRHFSGE